MRGLSVEGGYPFEERVSITLDLAEAEEFAVDLRLPEGTDSLTVTIGGEAQTLTRQPSGFLRVGASVESGETIGVEFVFAVEAHVAEDSKAAGG